MNSENNDEVQIEKEVTEKIKPYLEQIRTLENSLSEKETDLTILKYAYAQILLDIENLNKNAKKK